MFTRSHTTAYIRFDTHAKAVDAAKKLHAHIYKGALLSCVLKKRVDLSTRTDGKGQNRAGRLIIRNLHWKVSLLMKKDFVHRETEADSVNFIR